MKKTALLISAFACATAFAGVNDVRIMFSTPGPDTYADKTAVAKGERYALVWKSADTNIVTFAADGAVTGGRTVLVWDTTENGRCSDVFFTVNEDWLKAQKMNTGVWSVYLLDTRVYDAEGSFSYSAKNASGIPTVINASSEAVANVAAVASATAKAGVTSGTASALPEGMTPASVKDIRVEGDFVYVTVENTSPSINYVLAEGAEPGAIAPSAAAKPQIGNGTITLVSPKTGSKGFFTVNRK